MVANAAAMGANAVTMMRFDSTDMGAGRTEIVAYGTARVIVPVAANSDATPLATTSAQS
jgi:uncharacterized protein YbjQ (UPF0145 family)